MVDITEISAAVAAAGVLVGVVYYILDMRHQAKTRKTDVAIRLSEVWTRSDFMEAWCEVMERDPKDYSSYSLGNSTKWKPDLQIAMFFEEVAYLVSAGYADSKFVFNFFPIESAWDKLRFFIVRIREIRNSHEFYRGFEQLYDEVKKRE